MWGRRRTISPFAIVLVSPDIGFLMDFYDEAVKCRGLPNWLLVYDAAPWPDLDDDIAHPWPVYHSASDFGQWGDMPHKRWQLYRQPGPTN